MTGLSWTSADYKAFLARQSQRLHTSDAPLATPSKFRARPTRGFASKKEAAHYDALLMRLKAGEITRLECQPEFVMHTLSKDGEWLKVGRHKVDFGYVDVATGELVLEEVKGGKATQTEAWGLRRRHVESEYGLTIRIVAQ